MKNNLISHVIAQKIEQRVLRMSINARQIVLEESIQNSAQSDSIPVLSVITNINQRSMQVVEECSLSINKLILISDFANALPPKRLMPLLKNNYFDTISLKELDKLLKEFSLRERVVPCWPVAERA